MVEKKEPNCERIGATIGELLLDSSLIVATNKPDLYNVKLIDCGNYMQVYYLQKQKKKDKNLKREEKESKNILNIDTDNLIKKENKNCENNIAFKNIMRSKLDCQRLAKTNASEWKTFITLTFEENILDIDKANKELKKFIYKVKRVYNDLKYIGIPEFQKRGAVHYHILTNIDIDNTKLIYSQQNNEKFKHIKYWNNGFTKVDNLKNDIKKIIGYISKYMTKDADNRLYNRHRYFYSKNLQKPKINYLNLENTTHLNFYKSKLKNKELIYNNIYVNSYNEELIEFKEFL